MGLIDCKLINSKRTIFLVRKVHNIFLLVDCVTENKLNIAIHFNQLPFDFLDSIKQAFKSERFKEGVYFFAKINYYQSKETNRIIFDISDFENNIQPVLTWEELIND